MWKSYALILVLLSIGAPVHADYAEGEAAFKSGDFDTAVKEFRAAADEGNARAQWRLGFMYQYGRGIPQNYTVAAKWYRKAANQGLSDAQFNLGLRYYYGKGVVRDYGQAHKWWNLAASRAKTKQLRDKASKNRRIVEKKMTRNQVAKAQTMAGEWKPIK